MIGGAVVASTIGSGFTNAAGMGSGDLTDVFALGLTGALGIGSGLGTKGACLTWTVLMGMEALGVRSLSMSIVGVCMWGAASRLNGVMVSLGGTRSGWAGTDVMGLRPMSASTSAAQSNCTCLCSTGSTIVVMGLGLIPHSGSPLSPPVLLHLPAFTLPLVHPFHLASLLPFLPLLTTLLAPHYLIA